MAIFNYMFNTRYCGSILLYILIFALVSILAFWGNSINIKCKEKRYSNIAFIFSFIIAWFFYAFNDTGADLRSYIRIYSNSRFEISYFVLEGVEVGYRFINALLHLVLKNPYWGIGVIKTLQIFLIFYSIWTLRDKIHIGYAVMAYMALFYFQSFDLIRIYLAGAICLLSIALLIKRKKILSFILACISATIHTSAVVFVLSMILYFIYEHFKNLKLLIKITMLVVIPLIICFTREIVSILLVSGGFYDRYLEYLNGNSTVGIMQILFYIPIVAILHILNKDKKLDSQFVNISYIFSICGFAVAMCGYSIGMLSRIAIHFSISFIYLIPFYIFYREKNTKFQTSTFKLIVCKSLFVLYFIGRFILTISKVFIADGIAEFKFFF